MTYSVTRARFYRNAQAPKHPSVESRWSIGTLLVTILVFDALLIGGAIGLWHVVAWLIQSGI